MYGAENWNTCWEWSKKKQKKCFLGNLLHMSIAYQVLIDKTCWGKEFVFWSFYNSLKKQAVEARKTKMPQFQTPFNLKFMLLLCRLHTAVVQSISNYPIKWFTIHCKASKFGSIYFIFFKFHIFYCSAYFVRWTILFTFGFILY